MKRELKIYKCLVCGNIVALLHDGGGELVCCEQPMKLLVAGEDDGAAKEKHVPVVKKDGQKIIVNVGSVDHPMVEEHYIEFIVLATETKAYVSYLSPGQKPSAEFVLTDDEAYEIYEYCNLHGLWKA